MDALDGFRKHFAALSNKAYFNFGGLGTMPKESIAAILAGYDYVQAHGPFSLAIFDWLQQEVDSTKDALAAELGVARRCLALTHNVTEGCNIVMWGVEWQPGDHLVVSDSEHGSIIAIAERIAARRQVEVTRLPLMDNDVDAVKTLSEQLRPATRLVVLSHVLWNTGRIVDLAPLVCLCRQRGVPLLVDGAQSAGVLPLNLTELDVDYYAVTGHKWMCGPEGVSALYVRPELLEKLQPTFVGWRGVEMHGPDEAEATRFEVATSPFPLLAGLRAALSLHNSWGTAKQRFEQIRRNVSLLRERLQVVPGVRFMCENEATASLVSFAVEGMKPQAIVRKLENERVLLRSIPAPSCVRASVHYFTSEEDIDRLVLALKS